MVSGPGRPSAPTAASALAFGLWWPVLASGLWFRSPVGSFWCLVSGSGFWSSVFGFWFLVFGFKFHWQVVLGVRCRPPAPRTPSGTDGRRCSPSSMVSGPAWYRVRRCAFFPASTSVADARTLAFASHVASCALSSRGVALALAAAVDDAWSMVIGGSRARWWLCVRDRRRSETDKRPT